MASIFDLLRAGAVSLADAFRPRPAAGSPVPGDAARPEVPRRPDMVIYREPPIPSPGSYSPQAIQAIVTEHETGMFARSGFLAEAMDRNPRIYAALNTRVLGVLGLPRRIDPAPGDTSGAVARAWEDAVDEIAPPETLGELLRAYADLGLGLAEVITDEQDGDWIPRLRPWHLTHAYWRWDLMQYAVTTNDGVLDIMPGDGKWAMMAQSRNRAWMRGVVRCLGLQDAMRGYAVRDWARFCEKHGLPIVALKVPASQRQTNEVADFMASMSSLASEGTLILPQADGAGASFDATLLEPRDTSWESFERLIEAADRDVALAILGQNLTSDVTGGSFAAAKVHDRVRQDYLEADATILGQVLYRQLARPWALWNFGDPDLAPTTSYDAAPPEDQQQAGQALAQAGQAIALWSSALEKYNATATPSSESVTIVDVPALAGKLGLPVMEVARPKPALLPAPSPALPQPPTTTPAPTEPPVAAPPPSP